MNTATTHNSSTILTPDGRIREAHYLIAARKATTVVLGTNVFDEATAIAAANAFLADAEDEERDAYYDGVDLTEFGTRDESGVWHGQLADLSGRNDAREDDSYEEWQDENGKCRENYHEFRNFGDRLKSDVCSAVHHGPFDHEPQRRNVRPRVRDMRAERGARQPSRPTAPTNNGRRPLPVVTRPRYTPPGAVKVPVPQYCRKVTPAPAPERKMMVNPTIATATPAPTKPIDPMVEQLARAHGTEVAVIARAIAASGLSVNAFAEKHPTVRRDFVRAAKKAA